MKTNHFSIIGIKVITFVFVISFIVLTALRPGCLSANERITNSIEKPPHTERGWSLFSAPCNITIHDSEQKTGVSGIEAYSWNGSFYEESQTFERGKGYVISKILDFDMAGICDDMNLNHLRCS
jgi:hypothetical protein